MSVEAASSSPHLGADSDVARSSPSTVVTTDEVCIHVRHCAVVKADIHICYQAYGNVEDPWFLVVCGLNGHLGMYDPAFLTSLALTGPFYVIAFDNRDVGRSSKCDHVGSVHLLLNMLPNWAVYPMGGAVKYHLDDMALDAWALVDKLGGARRRIHILGVSMGGMISQLMALQQPTRVITLTLIMTTSGTLQVKQTALSTKVHLLKGPKSQALEDLVDLRVYMAKNVLLPAAPTQEDLDYARVRATAQVKRTTYRDGLGRQTAAISRAPCRDEALKGLRVPTLIMHGDEDKLVPVEHGYHLAQCIPASRLVVWPGVAHYITPKVGLSIVEEVTRTVRAAAAFEASVSPAAVAAE